MCLSEYLYYLKVEEKSDATIKQYEREIRDFIEYVNDRTLTKELVMCYKEWLNKKYEATSINAILVAINGYLRFLGKENCQVKLIKIQRQIYISENKELTLKDYKKMIFVAQNNHMQKLALIIETICSTGIRVSELQYITREALESGESIIQMKGKTRKILIPKKLQIKLKKYAIRNNLDIGPIFVTRSGRPMDRSNIWKMMKKLAKLAEITLVKVFPHNLRHLFAKEFYQTKGDIAMLADVLGHSSINTTRIYIMSTGIEHQQIIDELKLVN